MTKKRTDFVMLSRPVWEDMMIDDLDAWDCKLLLQLVLAVNYKNHKVDYSVRLFCQGYGCEIASCNATCGASRTRASSVERWACSTAIRRPLPGFSMPSVRREVRPRRR